MKWPEIRRAQAGISVRSDSTQSPAAALTCPALPTTKTRFAVSTQSPGHPFGTAPVRHPAPPTRSTAGRRLCPLNLGWPETRSPRLPDERCVLTRTEPNVRLGLAAHLLPGERESNRDDERRLGETDLGRERAVHGPSPVDRLWLLGHQAPGRPPRPPRTSAVGQPAFDAVDPRHQGRAAVVAGFEGERLKLPVVGGERELLARHVRGHAGAFRWPQR